MKKTSIIALLTAAILVAGIVTAGCTQDAGSPGSNPSGDRQQYAPARGDNSSPMANGGYHTPENPGGAGGNRQFRGQNPATNETMLIAAAGKLGVSEQELKNALNSTVNTTSGRPDFTAASRQLGISEQQLLDALGFPAAGFRGRGNMTAPSVSHE